MARELRRGVSILAIVSLTLAGCVSSPDGSHSARALSQVTMVRCATIDVRAERLTCYAMVNCATIGAPTDRLTCYDKLAAAILGSWQIWTEASKVDGSRNVYLSLEANAQVSNRDSRLIRPTLYVRCARNRTSLFVLWHSYLGTYNSRVLYRIDSAPARTESWMISADNEAIGLWTSTHAIPFIKRLFSANQLLMRVTPHRDIALTSTFEVAGLRQVIRPLRKACGW
jgi:type VI secretion system protein VasI